MFYCFYELYNVEGGSFVDAVIILHGWLHGFFPPCSVDPRWISMIGARENHWKMVGCHFLRNIINVNKRNHRHNHLHVYKSGGDQPLCPKSNYLAMAMKELWRD